MSRRGEASLGHIRRGRIGSIAAMLLLASQRTEFLVGASIFGALGVLTLLAGMLTETPARWVLIATLETAAVGIFLHAIEGRRRLADLANAERPPSGAQREELVRTAGRLFAWIAPASAVPFGLVWIGWGDLVLVPGIFAGAALWLLLEARKITRWEKTHNMQVLSEAKFGPRWLRGTCYVTEPL